MTYEELQKRIKKATADASGLKPKESYQALSECLSECSTVESFAQRRQAAIDLSNGYCKMASEAMELGLMKVSRNCVQDCKKLNALFPEEEHIAKNLVSCITGMAYIESAWGKTDTVSEYMDEVLHISDTYPKSVGVQREVGICLGSLIETCGCVRELRPLGDNGIERMKAVSERFPEDEELQTIFAHILVEGCKHAHFKADTERLHTLLDKLLLLLDEKTDVINTDAVRLRLRNIGISTEKPDGQEAEVEKESSPEQTTQNKLCLELQQSIEKVADHIPGWELAQSHQWLNSCLNGCRAIEASEAKEQTCAALADVYGKLAKWSMELENLQSSLDCVINCRKIYSMFPENTHIAFTLLQCLTGLTFVKHRQRKYDMVKEHINEVLEIANTYPTSVEIQRQAAMCMGNLVALCGNPNLPIDLAYDSIERMETLAERFPQDSDLQNVYAHILVSGCYYADRSGNAERLDQFRGKIRALQEQKTDVIDTNELHKHLMRVGLK